MQRSTSYILSQLPETSALHCIRSQKTLRHSDIMSEVSRRSDWLIASALDGGDRVVIGHEDALDYLLDIFAAWNVGICAVAVNPGLTVTEQKAVVTKTGARMWLGKYTLPSSAFQETKRNEPRTLNPDDPILILMTSGTSGNPKGVVHTFSSLESRIRSNIAEMGISVLQRSLCVLPIYFGHGLIGNCLTPLMAGGTLHLWSAPDIAEMRNLSSIIDQYDICFMSSVPAFWQLALRMSSKPQKALERVHIGSAPLSYIHWQSIADWAGTGSVFNMYGMTEVANWIACGSFDEAKGRDGFVGRAWGGHLSILTEEGEITSQGRGEVLIQSQGMMQGYWDEQALTKQSFIDGWFRTGDIGSLDEAGNLTLSGRIKFEINRAGIKVLAEEVDMLLQRHADVAEACAFAIPDPVAGEGVAAAVVMKEGSIFDEENIKAWCRDHVRMEAVPTRLFEFTSLPRSDRGKIIRAEVQRAASDDMS